MNNVPVEMIRNHDPQVEMSDAEIEHLLSEMLALKAEIHQIGIELKQLEHEIYRNLYKNIYVPEEHRTPSIPDPFVVLAENMTYYFCGGVRE